MRRHVNAVVVLALLCAGLVVGTSPAQAAAKSGVTIPKISYYAWGKIKPIYAKGPNTKIVSATVKVVGKTNAGKKVKKSGKTVKVAPGIYTVTTKVKFKVKKNSQAKKWSATKTQAKTFKAEVGKGAKKCAVLADIVAIQGLDDAGAAAWSVSQVNAQIGAVGMYFPELDMTLAQARAEETDPEVIADFTATIAKYGPDAVVSGRAYEMCASTKLLIVMFLDGRAWDYLIY
jgi:hypothetical protein